MFFCNVFILLYLVCMFFCVLHLCVINDDDSESSTETLQSLPVSVAATMNFAQLQTTAANDC